MNLKKQSILKPFYFFTCNVCKTDEKEVKFCMGCKLVSYCSIEHQKSDWKFHKDLCKCVQLKMKEWSVTNIFGLEAKSPDEWGHVRLSLISLFEKLLFRPLRIEEQQMFFFPNVCKSCFSANVNRQYKCDDCIGVLYCSAAHRDVHKPKHNKECSESKKCYILDKLFCENEAILELDDFPPFPHFDRLNFPEDMDSFMKVYVNSDNLKYYLLGDSLSGSLSIIHSIFSTSIQKSDPERLIIHVVGASKYEVSFIYTVELIFHCIPTLKTLNIVLIGPEMIFEINQINLCSACNGNVLTVKTYTCLYHDFILSKSFTVPNLVIAFNCGFSEFSSGPQDTWASTISSILFLRQILFIFTSYTIQEAMDDWEKVNTLLKNNESIIYSNRISHEANPFRSIRPQRNWEEHISAIFYLNNYISVFEVN